MSRTTNTSGTQWPARSMVLLLLSLATAGASAFYTIHFNPEVRFLAAAWHQKSMALKSGVSELPETGRPSPPSRVLFCGGSSVLVGIHPPSVEAELGVPVINLGMAAGMGPDVLTQLALNEVRRGDVLIISLEPDLLTMEQTRSMLGSQISWATGNPSWLGRNSPADWGVSLSHLRPGAYHLWTLAGKVLMRKPLYRYDPSELKDGGWQEIAARGDDPGIPVFDFSLTDQGRDLLSRVRRVCDERGAKAVYLLSRHFCPPARESVHREGISRFIQDVNAILDVVGPQTQRYSMDRGKFADTPWHPVPDEARRGSGRTGAELRLLFREWHNRE